MANKMSFTEHLSECDMVKLYNEKKFAQIISSLDNTVIVNKEILTNLPEDDNEKFQQLTRNFYYGKACYAVIQFTKAISSFQLPFCSYDRSWNIQ